MQSAVTLLIGLGNPGAAYAHTRHNAGFEVIDILSAQCGIPVTRARFHALVGEGVVSGARVALIKPQTFMNCSGDSVREALDWYKLPPARAFLLSDDIDLPLGAVRVRPFGGAGTHKGLRDILLKTGSDRFPRARIGVGAPPPGWDLADWVLSRCTAEERQTVIDAAFRTAAEAALCFLQHGIDLAMNRYNVHPHNDKPAPGAGENP